MGIREEYDFENLSNENERLVFVEIEKRLQEDDENAICRCEDCILDIVTLSLNRVKPNYTVSLMGRVYAHSGVSENEEIVSAVDYAIGKVTKNPAHDLGRT